MTVNRTPKYGIRWPDDQEHTRTWEHWQAQAEDAESALALVDQRGVVQAGSAVMSTTANGVITINFPVAFKAGTTPVVTAISGDYGALSFVCNVYRPQLTNAYVTIYVLRLTDGAPIANAGCRVDWNAIGVPA